MSNSIQNETIGTALVIRFCRPEIRNPLSVEVLGELTVILASLGAIEKVVFTGKDGVFASGANLKEIAAVSPAEAHAFAIRGQKLMKMVSDLTVTTVAAVNGVCFGGALDLAISCDRRVASSDAEFGHPGVGLGIITGWGGTQRLPRLIGEAATLEMFLTAERINAAEALRLGLIDKVCEDPVRDSLADSDPTPAS
ncbi:MAG: enoyl-CoA hydratase/isomerase family protein [Pyrinomonadaceae bacterium]